MTLDCIILLCGNSYGLVIEEEQEEALDKQLMEACVKKEMLIIRDGKRHATLNPNAIQGWYFKPYKPTLQERALVLNERAVKAVEKAANDTSTGEDWKGDDEDV